MAPDGYNTRPTADRVREAVFNALAAADRLDGVRFVDLFAGSGAAGIEALSRGAARCVFVEKDQRALRALRENIAALGLADRSVVVPGDVLAYSSANPGLADVAYVDPPYGFERWADLLATGVAGFVVAEAERAIEPIEGWESVRERRYGRTWVTFLADGPADDDTVR